MSRSTKKTPMGTFTAAESEKFDKGKWHKRFRQKTKQLLTSTRYEADTMEEMMLPDVYDVSNPCLMAKDGRVYHSKWKNGATEWFKKLMRK